jgi:hypothetical protein
MIISIHRVALTMLRTSVRIDLRRSLAKMKLRLHAAATHSKRCVDRHTRSVDLIRVGLK